MSTNQLMLFTRQDSLSLIQSDIQEEIDVET